MSPEKWSVHDDTSKFEIGAKEMSGRPGCGELGIDGRTENRDAASTAGTAAQKVRGYQAISPPSHHHAITVLQRR